MVCGCGHSCFDSDQALFEHISASSQQSRNPQPAITSQEKIEQMSDQSSSPFSSSGLRFFGMRPSSSSHAVFTTISVHYFAMTEKAHKPTIDAFAFAKVTDIFLTEGVCRRWHAHLI